MRKKEGVGMTRRERVIAALEHKETDIVPYCCEFTVQEKNNMRRFTGEQQFFQNWGLHIASTQYCGWPTERQDRPEHFIDDFGVEWNRSGADKDIGVVDDPLFPDPEEELVFRMPVLDEKRLRKEYEALIRSREDRFCIAGFGFCMFERSWSLMGMENLLMRMIIDPDSLEELYDRICEYNLHMIDIALEYKEIDGILFGDDWGQQRGMIMGPGHWRHFIKPRMKRMYDRVHEGGKYVLQHSCGDCSEILGDLVEIGLDCYQTFQPEIYNIEEIKKEYGGQLAFWGGISTQQLLSREKPETVKKETIRILKIMRTGGGYIAAPTHAVPFDVPPENICAMMEVFRNQEKYLS